MSWFSFLIFRCIRDKSWAESFEPEERMLYRFFSPINLPIKVCVDLGLCACPGCLRPSPHWPLPCPWETRAGSSCTWTPSLSSLSPLSPCTCCQGSPPRSPAWRAPSTPPGWAPRCSDHPRPRPPPPQGSWIIVIIIYNYFHDNYIL